MRTYKLFSRSMTTGTRVLILMAVLMLALVGNAKPAEAATISIDLCATPGTLPGSLAAIPMWGYVEGDCSVLSVASLPNPEINVTVGDEVTVILHNNLSENTALLFQGQDVIPDTTGVAPGDSKSYVFIASRPGTYLYEAGLLPNAQHQVAMGLYGALIVRPDLSVSGASTADDPTGTVLTDSAADFTGRDDLVGGTLDNTTDGSSCTIASLTATTLTCDAQLAGGTANTWTTDDQYTASSSVGFAYADLATAYNDESVLVLSEVDPALNSSANPDGFDMRGYAPKYFLINGHAYPETAPIPTASGNRVLLRYANAGLQAYSMSLLGLNQTAIAMDGSPFTYGRTLVAETIAPGQTADMIAAVPDTAPADSTFPLFDGNLLLHNGATGGLGGMLTFMTVSGTPTTGDTTGPATSNLMLTSASVAATVSDAGRGDSDVTAVEFFIDTTGSNGNGTQMDAFTPGVTVDVQYTFAPELTGSHTVYVHGMDAAGNWGPFRSALINNDTAGPMTSGLSLSPNPSNGTAEVALSATADDTASGGSTIAAAEYTIDSGTAEPMTVSPADAQIANVTASIPAAVVSVLGEGAHTVSVRSQDSLGNWGDPANISLTVDKTGPISSNVIAAPNPNNGTLTFNSTIAAVRVTATFVDAMSNIGLNCGGVTTGPATENGPGENGVFLPYATSSSDGQASITDGQVSAAVTCIMAEGFIDTVGANGSGFIFLPSDGLSNSMTESGYADIPMSTIGALSEGAHFIFVHGQDAAGNWGNISNTQLIIDKTAPAISEVMLTPNNTIVYGTASVTLNVTATDGGGAGAGTGISGGQYWIDGTMTPPANAIAFTGTSSAIDTSVLAGGVHTVYVRVQDGARNWSSVSSVTLTVIRAVDDALTMTANTQATQFTNVAAPGVLANDQPTGAAGRTANLVSGPVRTDGTGNHGTITITCPTNSNPGVCTNGAYRVTLNADPLAQGGNARRASKRGTYQFTYTETLNGVISTPATVTITVN